MVKINDKWIRIAGIPFAAFNSPYLYTELAQSSRIGFGLLYCIAIFQVGLIWEVNRIFIKIARKKYPELSQTRERLIYQIVYCTLCSCGIQTIYLLVHNRLPDWKVNFSTDKYWANYIVSIFILIAIIVVYEAFYFYRKLREKREETNRLKKEKVERELEKLKAQINPHFLFNSLNTLYSLIQVDTQKANHYLEEMATVYRYLLRNNHVELCSLAEEISFIWAYFHLIKTRHGLGVQLIVDVPERYCSSQIPPMTLQLLVENCVKHNIISLSKPLKIVVSIKNDRLVIENNLQKKKIAVASNKVGLSNIIRKYHLLNLNSVEIVETNDTFQVILPIIF